MKNAAEAPTPYSAGAMSAARTCRVTEGMQLTKKQ